jgi:hypothetical protein
VVVEEQLIENRDALAHPIRPVGLNGRFGASVSILRTSPNGRLVNLERVRALELRESGEYEVVLDSNIRLKLSRRLRKRLQDRLGGL